VRGSGCLDRLCVLFVSIALEGCGARGALEIDRWDRDADEPDAGATGPCRLETRRQIAGGAPGFAWSLAASAGGGYVVGYSLGWPPEEIAHVAALDSGATALGRDVMVGGGGGRAFATAEWTASVLAADELSLHRGLDGAASRTSLCRGCFVESPPVEGPAGVVVPVTRPDRVLLFVLPRTPTITHGPFAGAVRTHAVGVGDEVWLVIATAEGIRMDRLSWDAVLLTDLPIEVTSEAVSAVAAAPAGARVWIAAVTSRGDVVLIEADERGLVREHPIASGASAAAGVAVSVSAATIGVTWGDALGAGMGIHAAALDRERRELALGPTRISESTTSYLPTTAIAPHPRGHAIVYGGWEERTFYGVYATLLVCD
jgi:hypothetical protein